MGVECDFIDNLELYNVPLSDLLRLRGQIDLLIEQARLAEIDKVREALTQTAENLGIPVSDLIGKLTGLEAAPQDTPVPLAKAQTGIPKYFHPNDGRTWTGKGKRPKWVVEHIESGGTLEGLAGTSPETQDALPDPGVQEMMF